MFWVVTDTVRDKLAIALCPACGLAFCARCARHKYHAHMGPGSRCHASSEAISCGFTLSQSPVRASRNVSKPESADIPAPVKKCRSEEHTSELQSRGHLVCRLLLEKKNIDSRTLTAIMKIGL